MVKQGKSKAYGLTEKRKNEEVSEIGKWILDSNILVYWLMHHDILDYLVTKYDLSGEFKEVYSRRYEQAVHFVNIVLNKNLEEEFLLVELSLMEIFSGVKDEVRTIVMFMKGIPISRWVSRRETKEARISEEVSEEVYKLIMRGFDKLFEENRIEIVSTASPANFPDFFEVYSSLIFCYPELKTQDALLLTTSIFEKANFFVTMDGELRKLSKDTKEAYGLNIVKPEKALNILKIK